MNNKPVIFIQGERAFSRNNTYVQNVILKALSDGVTDPKELRRISGLPKIADVYRTLDKLAIRKEYHNALVANGIDLDFIVNGIKDLAVHSADKIRLGALQTVLKSIGLEKYEKQEDTGKGWEEAILELGDGKEQDNDDILNGEYEVKPPEIPESERLRQKEEKDLADELYEGKI